MKRWTTPIDGQNALNGKWDWVAQSRSKMGDWIIGP
jgi:hypothetical protein